MMEDDDGQGNESQAIWSCGAGTDGQLCTGRLEDEHFPQLVHFFSSSAPTVSQLSCGGAHVTALTSEGKVLTWGRGNSGQLGQGDLGSSLQPMPVTALESYCITHVSAGWSHSGFVSDAGSLYTCGDGSFGQLGHGDYMSHCSPMKVAFFADKHVDQIACGMRHSLVLLKGGRVYGFGAGKRGQLGISKGFKSINLPVVTCGLEDDEIVSVSANGDHSASLSAEGRLYTWGRGFSTNSDAYSAQVFHSSLRFSKVALGWNHALLLTDNGEVYMLGGNHHGVLSDSEKMKVMKTLSADPRVAILERVTGLDETKVVDIATGAEHSAVVTEEGVIKTWGWGEHGQLGLGNSLDQTIPQTVMTLCHRFQKDTVIFNIYCGSGFTIAMKTRRHLYLDNNSI